MATLSLAGPAAALQATDSDGDGVPDDVEGTADVDGDGIPNAEDAHDHWVSGVVPEAAESIRVWLVGSGEDGEINTADDVVVGKLDGPEFRFQNVNDGEYRVVVGEDPATADPALITLVRVAGAAVEGVQVGEAHNSQTAPVTTPAPEPTPTTVPQPERAPEAESSAPAALALDESESSTDPVLIGLAAVTALLFGVLLSYGYVNLVDPA